MDNKLRKASNSLTAKEILVEGLSVQSFWRADRQYTESRKYSFLLGISSLEYNKEQGISEKILLLHCLRWQKKIADDCLPIRKGYIHYDISIL